MKTFVKEVNGNLSLLEYSSDNRTADEKKMWREVEKATGEYPQFVVIGDNDRLYAPSAIAFCAFNHNKEGLEKLYRRAEEMKTYYACIAFAGNFIGYSIRSPLDYTSTSLSRRVAMGRLLKGHNLITFGDDPHRVARNPHVVLNTIADDRVVVIYGPAYGAIFDDDKGKMIPGSYSKDIDISPEVRTMGDQVMKAINRYIKGLNK